MSRNRWFTCNDSVASNRWNSIVALGYGGAKKSLTSAPVQEQPILVEPLLGISVRTSCRLINNRQQEDEPLRPWVKGGRDQTLCLALEEHCSEM